MLCVVLGIIEDEQSSETHPYVIERESTVGLRGLEGSRRLRFQITARNILVLIFRG